MTESVPGKHRQYVLREKNNSEMVLVAHAEIQMWVKVFFLSRLGVVHTC